MPVIFTRDDVLQVAALANLQLDAAEIELFARQLGDILAYARQVQDVDTTGIPPTTSVLGAHAADRGDVVQPSLDISATLANAPDADHSRAAGGFFKVPRVIG